MMIAQRLRDNETGVDELRPVRLQEAWAPGRRMTSMIIPAEGGNSIASVMAFLLIRAPVWL
jgi:hypothetical protein